MPPRDPTAAHLFAEPIALQGEPLANWMWLADPPGWQRALELTMGLPELARALQIHFADVTTLDCRSEPGDSPASAGTLGRARPFRLPYDDESFDLAAIHGIWRELLRLEGAALEVKPGNGVLRECRRVLRPGGCLYVAAGNPRYRRLALFPQGDRAASHSATIRAMSRRFPEAGFTTWQAYYVTPSHNVPRTIVPAASKAVFRHERFTTGRSLTDLLRQGLGLAGLGDVLHRSVVHLAYR